MTERNYFSYIRVSTLKQGQTGTSLDEQREAIQRYAERWSLSIVKEFEEKETAAKHGRPVFGQMLRSLKQGRARGVVIHKIDRSARNLKDWADLGTLIDQGIEVHFANESLDLQSRGGRLSADIQAVVAADFIRNLREETRKGFFGRIRQGLYPRPAPVGYLDAGKGKPKEIDPTLGPLVRKTFELYATGTWTLTDLLEKMSAQGLRNKKGNPITLNGISRMLRNPFYTGLIQIRGELFIGQHEPLVLKSVFDQVQIVLAGKALKKQNRQFFIFRRLARCALCERTLIGEVQKGHKYYRCQTKGCPQKTVREEILEEVFNETLKGLEFNKAENQYLRQRIKQIFQSITDYSTARTQTLGMQLEKIRERLSKLADAYIDGMLDKETYLTKKNGLIVEEAAIKSQLERVEETEKKALQRVEAFLELLNNACLSYKLGTHFEKRELAKIITSNFFVEGKNVLTKLNYPFQVVADRHLITGGSPDRGTDRTLSPVLRQLYLYFKKHELFPESEKDSQAISVPLDQRIVTGARKITSQPFAFGSKLTNESTPPPAPYPISGTI